jgi:hypothetical protein
MPTRTDDDPVHPNFDGISFNPTTDGKGVVVHPASGQTQFPLTYLTIKEATGLYDQLRDMRAGELDRDPKSYVAAFLATIMEDLSDALSGTSRP